MHIPWMPFYVADYLRDTRRLTTAEHGAYLLLIMEYWTVGGLPEDDSQLARIVGMTAAEWRKVRPTIQSFFHDGWCHRRIDQELLKAEAKHLRRSEAGRRGGIASVSAKQNSSNASTIAQASSSQPQPQEETNQSRGARKRGTRLPEGWRPNDDDWREARTKLGNEGSGQELLKFFDYWKAQPGQRGVKLDWDATWRNWIRNAKGPQNGKTNAAHNALGGFSGLAAQLRRKIAEDERRAAETTPGDGDLPGL